MNAINHIPVGAEAKGLARLAIRTVLTDEGFGWPKLDGTIARDAARKRGVGQQRALAKIQRTLGPAWSRCVPYQGAPAGSLAWRRLSGSMSGSVRNSSAFDPAMAKDPTLEVQEFIAHPDGGVFEPGRLVVSAHALGRCVQRGGARTVADLHVAVFALHDTLLALPEADLASLRDAWRRAADDEEARVRLPGPAGGMWSCALLGLAQFGTEGLLLTLCARTFLDRDMNGGSTASITKEPTSWRA